MKLRNKKTGEIGELSVYVDGHISVDDIETRTIINSYDSLAKLYEKWEDYEEPKEYWYIDYCGCICNSEEDPVSPVFMLKEIGNYFETREEAEKAVEKLKAWKRLKDKGFGFEAYKPYGAGITFTIAHMNELAEDNKKDLDLLFGGDE